MSAPVDIYRITNNKLHTFYFRRQEYSPDLNLEFQTYDEYLKIFRIVSGTAMWKIEKKEYTLEKDDIFILNNTERRRLIMEGTTDKLVMEYIQFLPIMLFSNQQCVMPFFFRYPEFSNKINRESRHYPEILSLFEKMSDACAGNERFKNEYIYSILLQILVNIGRETDIDKCHESSRQYCNIKNYEIISEAVRYITQNPYEDLSEDALAKKFYVSKYYFSHLFKLYNGMNLLTYVKICRVNYAMDLIRSKNMSISDAAFCSGFGCISGFYKAVKDITGMSPGKLTKRIESDEKSPT
ncbi:MAG: helix-turn-helix domain-containing protein [Eubacteriales bacterium]